MSISKLTSSAIEPLYVSIKIAADYTAESQWKVKERLRDGTYRARKSGRRTLVEFASVKEHAVKLPKAEFAPPHVRRQRNSGAAA
jgi:hypothetical protein